jgi:uncharacterized membrane protein YedE/YeeE
MNTNNSKKTHYINPYLGGVLLGITMLLTIFISGRELGVSGAVKDTVVEVAHVVSPKAAEQHPYYGLYIKKGESPMNAWLVYEVLGIFIGALLSGILFRRVRKPFVEHGPNITSKRRLLFALLGGIIWGFGTRLGRGCTSGAALSGSSTFSYGGVMVMLLIFATAYLFAYFFRKLWT